MKKLLCVFCVLFLLPVVTLADDHAHHHHDMPAMTAADAAPAEAGDTVPLPTADALAAAFPDLHGMDMRDHMSDNATFWKVQLDQLEMQDTDAHTALAWSGKAWWGKDFDKLWLHSEGERAGGRTGELEHQLLWGHAISPWWETLLGLRQDGGEGPARTWAAVGVQGLAPYFFELAATAFVGKEGRTAFRLEAEYEWLLTNRLILQPAVELNAYGKDDAEAGKWRGLSDLSAGLRLRYEFWREFAPYVGVEWSHQLGRTADHSREAGGDVSDTRAVAGLRIWF